MVGITHTHPGHRCRAEPRGNHAATTLTISAPIAAVAAQPYQYIAGARKPIAGSVTPFVCCVPASTIPSEGKTVNSAKSFATAITYRKPNVVPNANAKRRNAADDVMRDRKSV